MKIGYLSAFVPLPLVERRILDLGPARREATEAPRPEEMNASRPGHKLGERKAEARDEPEARRFGGGVVRTIASMLRCG